MYLSHIKELEKLLKAAGLPTNGLQLIGRAFQLRFQVKDKDYDDSVILMSTITGLVYADSSDVDPSPLVSREFNLSISPENIFIVSNVPLGNTIEFSINNLKYMWGQKREGKWSLCGQLLDKENHPQCNDFREVNDLANVVNVLHIEIELG